MSELKSCPFCGGEAELVESEVGCQVYCSECDCGTVSDDWVRRAAVEMWNNRTNRELATVKAEIAELVDTLDKLLDEARGLADQVHYEYGIGEQVYDESITNAEKLLAKTQGI